jgi:uncharacterized protein YkwD
MLTRRLVFALMAAACSASAFVITPAAVAASSRLSPTERAVIRLINQTRARHGLPALRPSRRLARAADGHSLDMVKHDFFAHQSSDGTPFDRRVREYARARAVGENLAMISGASRIAHQVVTMWLHSPPHRAALLSSSYGRIGVGTRSGQLGGLSATVFTADFASRR